MPSYSDPITPAPLPVWFDTSDGPNYGIRETSEKFSGSTRITHASGSVPTGGGYQAFTEPNVEMPGSWPDDLLAMVQVDDPPVSPFVSASTGGNVIRWTIDQFTDGFLDLTESVHGAVSVNANPPHGWEPTYDINLQDVPFPSWAPFYSGITTPPGALGWELVEDGEILEQNLTLFHGGLTGYVDDLQLLVAITPTTLDDNSFTNKYHSLYADGVTLAALTPTRTGTATDDTGLVKPLPVDFRPTSAGSIVGVPSPAVMPPLVAEVGAPPWLPGVEPDELNASPWSWRFEIPEGSTRSESMYVDCRARFDYVWQPPTFRWILPAPPFSPPCRGYPRTDLSNTAARGYPPPKSSQSGNRAIGYY